MILAFPLDNMTTYGYNFTLQGVAQPSSYSADKKIFVALDMDMDFSNGLNFFTYVFDQAVDVTTHVLLLPVLKCTYSSNETKATFTLKADLKLA